MMKHRGVDILHVYNWLEYQSNRIYPLQLEYLNYSILLKDMLIFLTIDHYVDVLDEIVHAIFFWGREQKKIAINLKLTLFG